MTRLEKLLKLARSSPFEGERRNAIAAAKKFLKCGEGKSFSHCNNEKKKEAFESFDHFALRDHWIKLDKERISKAMEEARALGLDARVSKGDMTYRGEVNAQLMKSLRAKKTRDPLDHATVLMRETLMDLGEISSLTGIDLQSLEEVQCR